MNVRTFPLGPLETNCFLIHNAEQAIIVDPGGNPAQLLTFLEQRDLKLTHILNTHLHFDHTYGNKALSEATGAPILASAHDSVLLDMEGGRGGVWGFPVVEPYVFTNLEAGPLELLGQECRVLATPGHTPGGLSFYLADPGCVFCGDALFYRSVGRTDFPFSNTGQLVDSIRTQLFGLPEKTRVCCGHGPDTLIADERRNNPFCGEFAR